MKSRDNTPPAAAQAGPDRWSVPPIEHTTLPPPPAPVTAGPTHFRVASPRPEGTPRGRTSLSPWGPREHTFTWVATHGGAGASSLARAGHGGYELLNLWPSLHRGWPPVVALVARANAAGLDNAAQMLQEVAAGMVTDLRVIALVTVADAPGRATRQTRTRIHELSGAVAHVLHVPWIAAWRDAPYTPHPACTQVAAQMAALAQKEYHP